MDNKFTVELRLNNTLFKCALEGKFYNAKKTTAYAISSIAGFVPNQQGGMNIATDQVVICEKCYKINKADDLLALEEPSKIVLPTSPKLPLSLRKN